MLFNPSPSQWTYNTSSAAGGSLGFAAGGVGELTLNAPPGAARSGGDAKHRLHFAISGVSAGRAVKLPVLGRIQTPKSYSLSTNEMKSGGLVFRNAARVTGELKLSDFRGGAIQGQFEIGLIDSVAASATLVGINPALVYALTTAIASTFDVQLLEMAVKDSRAIVLSVGETGSTAVVAGSLSFEMGYMY